MTSNGTLGTPIMAETFGGLVTIYSTKEYDSLFYTPH